MNKHNKKSVRRSCAFLILSDVMVSKIRLDDNTILCIRLIMFFKSQFAKVYFINDAFGEIVDIPAGIVIHCDTNNAILSDRKSVV